MCVIRSVKWISFSTYRLDVTHISLSSSYMSNRVYTHTFDERAKKNIMRWQNSMIKRRICKVQWDEWGEANVHVWWNWIKWEWISVDVNTWVEIANFARYFRLTLKALNLLLNLHSEKAPSCNPMKYFVCECVHENLIQIRLRGILLFVFYFIQLLSARKMSFFE